MNDDDRVRRLEELVRDERARRVYAEGELAAERERTQIWRKRAEERAETLRGVRRGRSRRKRPTQPAPPASTTPASDPTGAPQAPPRAPARICHPTLRVGTWDVPGWWSEAADTFSVRESPDSLAWADMVVVGSPGAGEALAEWVAWEARPPLVLWEPSPESLTEWEPCLTARDLIVGGPAPPAPVPRLPSLPVVLPAEHRVMAEAEWLEVSEDTTLEEMAAAAAVRPVRWVGTARPPGEAAGLVAAGPDRDPAKQALQARLTLRSRFSPGAALERVAQATGIDLPPWRPEVGLLVVTRRPDRVPEVLEQLARFHYPRVRVVVGLHGIGDPDEVADQAWRAGVGERTLVESFPEDWPLGRCLNRAAEMVGSALLAKVDDDDLYGPWYLDEAVAAIEETGADLVGKMTQYVRLVASDRLVLYQPGKEHAEVGYVNGPTFVMPRATWERVRFPHRRARVDSTFVRGLRVVEGTIRTTSRYEFVLGRYPSGHTWESSDDHFLARGELVGPGSDLSAVWLEEGAERRP